MHQKYVIVVLLASAAVLLGAIYGGGLGRFGQAMAANSNATQQTVEVTYSGSKSVDVASLTNATAIALCKPGDTVVNGGYEIKYASAKVTPNSVFLTSNTPVVVGTTTKAEGWQAGLINTGTDQVSITAHTLCSGLRIK